MVRFLLEQVLMMVTKPKLGKRRTTQREAITEVIDDAPGPLTVSQIYERSRHATPNLGIATVYRTLKLLLDNRQVHAVVLPDGETRYEKADMEHHCHFHCRTCGEVYNLVVCPVSIPEGTTFPDGFCVDDHELTLHGTCPRCSVMEG